MVKASAVCISCVAEADVALATAVGGVDDGDDNEGYDDVDDGICGRGDDGGRTSESESCNIRQHIPWV